MKCICSALFKGFRAFYLLAIGLILVARNNCQNINFTFLYIKNQRIHTEAELHSFLNEGLSGYNMTHSVKAYNFSTTFNGLEHLNSIFADSLTDVVIASTPYEFVNILGDFANQYDKLLIVNNNNFPTFDESRIIFMRTGHTLISSAVTEFLSWFRWSKIAVILSEKIYWEHMVVSMENDLMKNGFKITHSRTISKLSVNQTYRHVFEDITSDEKAIILTMEHTDIALILPEIDNWTERDKHSYFILSRDPYKDIDNITSAFINLPNVSRVLESCFVILPIVPNIFEIQTSTGYDVSFSDISSMIGQGYHKSLQSGRKKFDSRSITYQIKMNTFYNQNRTLKILQDDERFFDFALYDYNPLAHSFQLVRYMNGYDSGTWTRNNIKDISWPNDNELPPDECFLSDVCLENSGVNLVLAIASPLGAVAFIILLVIFGVYLWRKHADRLMTKGPNKIILQLTDLTFLHRKNLKSNKLDNSSQRGGVFGDKPDIVKGSEKANNRSMVSLHEFSEISEIARYKGDIVYVKEIPVKGFEISSKFLAHFRTLREIRHENLNPMYGLLLDPTISAIVSEHCNRGSLQDVIRSANIKLDWDFKVSLLTDLVRGLRFIQNSPIKFHGNLKSRNCVIDSRWVLKLTDFGLKDKLKMTSQAEFEALLWTAPEHLREPVMKGSEKGDMYGFAIISQELILRMSPFGMTDLKPAEIIKKLQKPPPLLRPSVSNQAAPPQYVQLMKSCWAENPDMRPSIEEVYHQYKTISGGKKLNIVDSMFRMLEKYSNDLEDIVKERTMELEEEKKKTDLLLFRMLPPTVAESLKVGKSIEAETFTEVTIYFSDIVGFTTISAMSTPMQVVDLLNDLYTMFDATINNYDVYKVETIGDAYMVASGLPVPNGNRHAGEIGTMALDLLSQCGKFTIRHMPEVPLRLRIGLHSGPCVAGVVGLTMPRYCLFGDTVNTASRMESTGAAFRIHISQNTKTRLDELGSYKMEYRGEVELKGKGLAKTYWLAGKDGFNKPLPEPPPLDCLGSILAASDRPLSRAKTTKEKSDTGAEVKGTQPIVEAAPVSQIQIEQINNKSNVSPSKNDVNNSVDGKHRSGIINHISVRTSESHNVDNKSKTTGKKCGTLSQHVNTGSNESIRDQTIVCNGSQGESSFRNSPSDSSLVTKASILSTDSVVSTSDCELKILKRTSKEDNTSTLSPVSEV